MNGVEVKLKNPGTEGLKDFLTIQKAMSKMPKINPKGKTKEELVKELEESDINFMDYIDEKAMDSLVKLVNLSVHKTFPDYNDEIDGWAMKNSMAIMNNVIELCMPEQKTDNVMRVDALKEKIQDAKSVSQ